MTSLSNWALTPERYFFSASGNAEAVEGLFDFFGDFVPGAALLVGGAQVVEDVLEVEADVAAPVRHGLGVEDFERLEAELAHPVGLVLDVGNLMDDFGIQTLVGLEDGFGFGAEIVLVDFGRNGGVENFGGHICSPFGVFY